MLQPFARQRSRRIGVSRSSLSPLWISCVLFLMSACNEKNSGRRAHSGSPERQAWVVHIGASGGFTGGGSGHTIHADGTVISWSRLTPEDRETRTPLGTAAPETLARLDQALRAEALAELVFQESGNMTAFLEVQRGSERWRFSWPERYKKVKLPTPLAACYEAAMAVVQSVRDAR